MRLCRNRLYLKSIGVSLIFSIAAVDIAIPVLTYLFQLSNNDFSRLYYQIISIMQFIIPISSVWWVVLIVSNFTDTKDCEILYSIQNRNELLDVIIVYISFIPFYAPLFAFFGKFGYFNYPFKEFFRVFAISVLFFGVTYLLEYITKSALLPLLFLIVYTAVCYILKNNISKNIFIVFYNTDTITNTYLLKCSLPLFSTGVLLLFLGKKQRGKKM